MTRYSPCRSAVAAIVVLFLAFPVPPAFGDEIKSLSTSASIDATLQQAAASTNDGVSQFLRALSQSAGNVRHLVQFDLASNIDTTAAVKTSRLTMTVNTAPLSSRNLDAHLVTGAVPWTEGNVTWNDRTTGTPWGTGGGDFNPAAADTQPTGTTAGAQLSWNILTDGTISNIPQGWLDGSVNNRGLVIKDATEGDAAHAVIKQVQSGSVTLCTATPCTTTVNLASAVDVTKAFLIFGARNAPSSNQGTMQIRGELANATQITFFRRSDSVAVNVDWYLIEYQSGVCVQRGTAVQNAASINIDLSVQSPPATVNPPCSVSSSSQMFALYSKNPGNEGTFNRNNPLIAEVTSTTNVNLRAGTANNNHTIAYQVVYFLNPADITVQRGTLTPNALTGATLTNSAAIAAVDPGKSFILTSYRSTNVNFQGNDTGARIITAQFSGCTTTCNAVTFDRSISGSPDSLTDIHYQVITLNDRSATQSGSLSFTGSPVQNDQTIGITSVDTTRSFAFSPVQYGGGQNAGRAPWVNNQNPGVAGFGMTFPNSTSLRIRRGFNIVNPLALATVIWQVVQAPNISAGEVRLFSREDGTPGNRPNLDVSFLRNVSYGTVTPGISEITLNWTFPAGSTGANYDGVLFARRQGAIAPTFAPLDGTAYTVGQEPVVGEFVAADTNAFATISVTEENGPDNVIVPNTQYTYKAYTHDANTITGAATPAPPHYSFGVPTTTTTLVAGGANKNWSYKSGATTLSPPGLLPGGSVVTGSNDNKVHSMAISDGARRYQPAGLIGTVGGAIQSRPPVIEAFFATNVDCDKVTGGIQTCDVTYVGAGDGKAYAFNIGNGQMIWTAATQVAGVGGSIQGGASVQLKKFSNIGFVPACAPCDLVYFGTRNTDTTSNSVVALNADTGAVVWTFQPGNMDIITSTPLVDYTNNALWVTSLSNGGAQPSLWKINSATGALVTSFNLGDISGSATNNRDNRVVYVATDAGALVAVRTDVASCTTTLAAAGGSGVGFPVPSPTATNNDDIFFTTTGTVNKFHFTYTPNVCTGTLTDLNGTGWTNPALTNPSGVVVLPFPVVNPPQIFVGDGTGRIQRIHAVTGAIAASRDVNLGFVIGEPAIDFSSSKIFVGDSSGRIYSFNLF